MAQDINSVFVIGRLTRDPEVKYTTGGTAKMEISIAVNRSVKEGDSWVLRPSYFDVEYWGKRAESINQFLFKGKQIGVQGYLDQKRWTTEGQNRSKIVIVAENIELLGGDKQEGHPQQSKPTQQQGFNYDDYSYGSDYSDKDFPEEIPF